MACPTESCFRSNRELAFTNYMPTPVVQHGRWPGMERLGELRNDLERFVFLLGGSDGETLFGP